MVRYIPTVGYYRFSFGKKEKLRRKADLGGLCPDKIFGLILHILNMLDYDKNVVFGNLAVK